MTRKDYRLIAAALMSATPLAMDGEVAHRVWAQTVAAVSRALYHYSANDINGNRRYDESRFMDACMGRGR